MPVLAANDIELAADTVLAVEGTGLDVPGHHQVEGCVRRLVRIRDAEVVAADAQVVLRVETAVLQLLLQESIGFIFNNLDLFGN